MACMHCRDKRNAAYGKSSAVVRGATVVEIVDMIGEAMPLLVHDERRAEDQPLAALLDRRHQNAHGIFADARMKRGDLDAAETTAAGGDDLGDRLRPGDQRQLSTGFMIAPAVFTQTSKSPSLIAWASALRLSGVLRSDASLKGGFMIT